MKATLRQQARELAALTARLKRETARREAAETSLAASKKHYGELLARSHLAREQKRQLARQILLAHEEERRQISRTLHDEISQTLVGINTWLTALTVEAAANTENFKKKVAAAHRMVQKSVGIVHRFARELRPTLLDDLGLIPALHAYLKDLRQQTGLHIRFTAFAGVEKMDSARRTALFRVAQSALTNVARHAKATVVNVRIEKTSDGACLEVRDDGRSFQVERVLHAKRYKRLGLLSMRERVETFGGTFAVESAPGKGTTLRACVPFDKKKD